LERCFNAPVIEAYGMTEASHQIASNPLPPGLRKPRSVGLPTGSEVAIVDATGRLLTTGATGEIVVRGDNVMHGYAEHADGNARTFTDGWFRTGDEGFIDAEGYVYLTGRLKDIINRGGEKVSPREIDDVLLQNEAVTQAVTFRVPHPTLGEDIAAAVVLKKGAAATADEIRASLFGRLDDVKIPSQVVVVDAIAGGATGKVDRDRLATALAEQLRHPFVAPKDGTEAGVAAIFHEVLDVPRIGAHDNFFVLGGDSIRALQALARIREQMRAELTIRDLFAGPTVAQLAREVTRSVALADTLTLERILAEVEQLSDEEATERLRGTSVPHH
jgi:aryl carrier-like protein